MQYSSSVVDEVQMFHCPVVPVKCAVQNPAEVFFFFFSVCPEEFIYFYQTNFFFYILSWMQISIK